jgi:hypothetical protein
MELRTSGANDHSDVAGIDGRRVFGRGGLGRSDPVFTGKDVECRDTDAIGHGMSADLPLAVPAQIATEQVLD